MANVMMEKRSKSKCYWDLRNSMTMIEFYCLKVPLLIETSIDGFYRKLLVAASKIGLKQSSADPCLHYK
jgi:hypothetical protein